MYVPMNERTEGEISMALADHVLKWAAGNKLTWRQLNKVMSEVVMRVAVKSLDQKDPNGVVSVPKVYR